METGTFCLLIRYSGLVDVTLVACDAPGDKAALVVNYDSCCWALLLADLTFAKHTKHLHTNRIMMILHFLPSVIRWTSRCIEADLNAILYGLDNCHHTRFQLFAVYLESQKLVIWVSMNVISVLYFSIFFARSRRLACAGATFFGEHIHTHIQIKLWYETQC